MSVSPFCSCREVVDDFKYRDGFLNGPEIPDYGLTVNLDDAPV